jgi:hypothetical protein
MPQTKQQAVQGIVQAFANTHIDFNEDTLQNAGYVMIDDHHLRKQDHDSLSYLVFYMTYSRQGKALWAANRPYGGTTPEQAKTALMTRLQADFAGVPAPEREALIDAHIAASLYQNATIGGNQNPDEAARQATIYKQKIAYICGQLYEHGLAHDFSMSW